MKNTQNITQKRTKKITVIGSFINAAFVGIAWFAIMHIVLTWAVILSEANVEKETVSCLNLLIGTLEFLTAFASNMKKRKIVNSSISSNKVNKKNRANGRRSYYRANNRHLFGGSYDYSYMQQNNNRLFMEQMNRDMERNALPFEHGGLDMTWGNSFNNCGGMF